MGLLLDHDVFVVQSWHLCGWIMVTLQFSHHIFAVGSWWLCSSDITSLWFHNWVFAVWSWHLCGWIMTPLQCGQSVLNCLCSETSQYITACCKLFVKV
jgi:hypothetical protein